MSKGSAIVGFIACFIAGMFLMWGVDTYSGGSTAATKDSSATKGATGPVPAGHATAKVPITNDDPSWGSPTALVTLVLFSDYQCPFCTRVEPTLAALKKKYGPDKLRVVWKHFPLPFHKKAVPAHVASQTVFKVGVSANDGPSAAREPGSVGLG